MSDEREPTAEAAPTRKRTVLDDIKRGEICAILSVGCTRAVAARYVGCHPSTIRATALRDESFAEAIAQAESRHEVLQLTYISKAAKDGRYWRAAAWALERTYPERYAHRQPRVFTLEQIAEVLSQFAEIIVGEVPEAQRRELILSRLDDFTAALQAADSRGTAE